MLCSKLRFPSSTICRYSFLLGRDNTGLTIRSKARVNLQGKATANRHYEIASSDGKVYKFFPVELCEAPGHLRWLRRCGFSALPSLFYVNRVPPPLRSPRFPYLLAFGHLVILPASRSHPAVLAYKYTDKFCISPYPSLAAQVLSDHALLTEKNLGG